MTALLEAVRRHVRAGGEAQGPSPTAIPGLQTVCATAPSGLLHAISRPMVCLVVQGAKHVSMGAQGFSFAAGDSLLITADVPKTIADIEALMRETPHV